MARENALNGHSIIIPDHGRKAKAQDWHATSRHRNRQSLPQEKPELGRDKPAKLDLNDQSRDLRETLRGRLASMLVKRFAQTLYEA
jgi:hypothetical protein